MMIWIDNETKKRVNIHAAYKGRSKLDTPEIRAAVGVIEIPDPLPPDDFSDDIYFRSESEDAPYVIYTKKPDKQIVEAHNKKVWQQIDAVEKESLMPRQLRDFLLGQTSAEKQPWYKKVKSVDDQVIELKAGLK